MQLKAGKTLPLGVNLKIEKLGQHNILMAQVKRDRQQEECLGSLASHLRSIHSVEARKGREDKNPGCFSPSLGLSFPVGTIGVDEGCPKASLGFPNSSVVKDLLQCGRPEFDSWVGKIPWRRERLPIPVFCPGEFHGLYSP